jgi:hypothetical protein
MQRDGTRAADSEKKAWLPFLWITVACALAHLGCLSSQFYMDDFPQILDSEKIRTGHFIQGLNTWTAFGYCIQYQLCGHSSVAFHAVNWLLHTAVAWVLFGFGRDFLKGKWPSDVALFGALLFAVHPLASEIPNYARTQDLAWVTLFSLLAGWAMLHYLHEGCLELATVADGEIPTPRQTGRGWKLFFCGMAITGATFSKGPGLLHAAMVVGVVTLTNLPQRSWKIEKRRVWGGAVILAVVGTVVWASGMLGLGLEAVNQWREPRFIGHAYTIGRVFWEFFWRSIVPVSLSSDHQIAETLIPPGKRLWDIPDKVAMLAMVGMLAMAGLSGWLTWRKSTRLCGACSLLFVATILFRVLYLIPEFMPEYRIYPGLPWFCLGAAILLSAVWKWIFEGIQPRVLVVALLALFAFLSAKRSFLWHDLDRLMADVLSQYPAQGRAIWELDDRDLAAGKWQAVIDRQQYVWPEVRRKFISQLRELAPARELPTGHFSLAEVACMGHYARAISHEKSPADGLRLIDELEAYMRAMKINPVTNWVHWNLFSREKALVLETAGNYQAALHVLKPEDSPPNWPLDFERISKELADSRPPSSSK